MEVKIIPVRGSTTSAAEKMLNEALEGNRFVSLTTAPDGSYMVLIVDDEPKIKEGVKINDKQ
jgi:hypothetical protein